MSVTLDAIHALQLLMYCIYLRFVFGIAYLAYHTATKYPLCQPLYPELIVNCFDI